MLPSVGWNSPVIRLIIVVLPAPLGPISPCTEPRRTSVVSPSTAATPPKRLITLETARTGAAYGIGHLARRALLARRPTQAPGAGVDQAARQEHHDEQQRETLGHVLHRGDHRLHRHRQRGEHRRPDDGAEPVEGTAEHG